MSLKELPLTTRTATKGRHAMSQPTGHALIEDVKSGLQKLRDAPLFQKGDMAEVVIAGALAVITDHENRLQALEARHGQP